MAQSGNSLNPNITLPKLVVSTQMVKTHMMFMKKPAFIMSTGFIFPAAKTIALGGVATGNMKAYEQVAVAGSMRNSGLTCTVYAISDKIGKRILAIAVLDATSVMAAVIMQIINIIANGGRALKPAN